MQGSARLALRTATGAAHDRVDALFSRFDLTDRSNYAAFLSAHAEAFLPVEAALDATVDGTPADWPERRRGSSLTADLADLGRAPDEDAPPVMLPDRASAAGMIYVLEGSRLGGRVIARALPPAWPRRYLDPGQRPPSWAMLLGWLETQLTGRHARDAAAAAALQVFERFERAATHWLPGSDDWRTSPSKST